MTDNNSSTPTRSIGWRLALLLSGAAMLMGGSMHPSSEATDSVRQELATMTADESWVPGHSLIVLSTLLLALGLWLALRAQAWGRGVQPALKLAAIAVSIYVVETVFHLAAAVDSDELAHGDAAPVAFTHVGLSILLYPISGLAIAYLAGKLWGAWTGPLKLVAIPGIVGGVVHSLSVPLTLLLPDAELSMAFAGAAVLIAIWSIGSGLVGIRNRAGRPVSQPVAG